MLLVAQVDVSSSLEFLPHSRLKNGKLIPSPCRALGSVMMSSSELLRSRDEMMRSGSGHRVE